MKIRIFLVAVMCMMLLAIGMNTKKIEQLGYAEIIATSQINKVLSACVVVRNEQSCGSGVAIKPNLILTAKHCVADFGNYIIGSNKQKYDVIDFWASDKYDVAFMVVDANLPFLSLGKMPKILDDVYVVGSPLPNAHELNCLNNITKGIVSNLNINWHIWIDGIVVDAAAYPGNSGGPLLNKDFNIVGIMVGCHNRLLEGGDNFWLAEPVIHIKEALKDFENRQVN